MIRSMTAFASGERSTEWGTLTCELRAVNHRFLELGTRMPEELRGLEPALRERVSAAVSRGKVELGLRLRSGEGGGELQLARKDQPRAAPGGHPRRREPDAAAGACDHDDLVFHGFQSYAHGKPFKKTKNVGHQQRGRVWGSLPGFP